MRWIGIVVVLVLAATSARADDANPKRRTANRVTKIGVAGLLLGAAFAGTAAGLGDHPGPQEGFTIAAGTAAGLGAVTLGVGLYLRATSPDDPPDAVDLDADRSRRRWERRVGVSMASLGALAVAVGVAHAFGAAHDNSLAADQCPNDMCNADGARLLERAHTLALAADLLIGPGLFGVAGGILLYRHARDTNVQVVPVVGPTQAGAAIVGRF